MTNLLLWLMSYIGFTMGLTIVNNRPATIRSLDNIDNHAILTSTDFNLLKPTTTGIIHELLLYNKNKKSNNVILLDELLSTILDDMYKQKQRHLSEKLMEQIKSQEDSAAHSSNFLYNENNHKLRKKDKQDRLLPVLASESRMILSSDKPYTSANIYMRALTPVQNVATSRLKRLGINRNLNLSKPRKYTNMAYDSEANGIATMPKSLDKRNRISSNLRQNSKELQQESPATAIISAGSNMASQFILRSARGNRQYDVPQIECPLSEDGMERFACPTADRMGRYRCIDDHVLCDGFIDCPMGEDEDRQACMFYKTTKAHLDVLADALLRWARGR